MDGRTDGWMDGWRQGVAWTAIGIRDWAGHPDILPRKSSVWPTLALNGLRFGVLLSIDNHIRLGCYLLRGLLVYYCLLQDTQGTQDTHDTHVPANCLRHPATSR